MSRRLETIESVSNPNVKSWVRLREGKHRRASGLFWVEGDYEVKEALAAGVAIHEGVLSAGLASLEKKDWVQRFEEAQIPWREVGEAVFQKLAYREHPDGVGAVAAAPNRNFQSLEKAAGLLVVVNRVEKPGNLGALIRTAKAVGATGILHCNPACDFENPQVIRASRGLVFSVPGWVAETGEAIAHLQGLGYRIVTADKGGTSSWSKLNWSSPLALVLGEEHGGLPYEWLSGEFESVSIPMEPGIDSLNLSVSGALLMYEWYRNC